MKKILFAIATVALVFATSCKKENVNAPETLEDSEFYCVIDQNANPQNAPAIEDGMGTMATIDGQNQIFWQTTDEISYYGCMKNAQGGYDAAAYHTLKCKSLSAGGAYFEDEGGAHFSGQGDHKAYYPASLVVNDVPTLPATIAYDATKSASYLPMYGTGNGSHYLTFNNICAAMKITMPVAGDTFILRASKNICGAFKMVGTTAELINKTNSDSATITVSGEFAAGEVVYVSIPAGTYNDFSFELFNDGQAVYQTPSRTITVNVNKIYPVDITVPDPLLSGVFSVSATKQVQFTRGNLYWNGANWHMEANQAAYPTTWNPNHVGHFYFAETAAVAYGTSAPTSSNYLFCDGSNNRTMTVEGESGLYVLSSAEWNYILNNYTNKAYQTIDDNPCLLIANDSTTSLTNISTVANIPSNVLCLPVAGLRSVNKGNTVITIDKYGSGWYLSSSLSTTYGYDCLFFTYGYYDVFGESSFQNATPIRLVKTYTGN